ncbi:Imm57 family immunity protein [Escherichia albertii]|nr:Imm57 family immunity protein [Escherichia albertii]MCU7271338.1 Imm57 family immunity protein [Escherichia albertii]MCU7276787.1 Imm57 family immunity protein [Escherichia albertii]MCZ8629631.1 Imm57 family immunity protein [Escherichia albertii]MCZ8635949.1 Imm57 family immunity protein [Escherichia albertii]MCZ8659857.1 Imm57 family immunity protein [Escherichia albertii]
MINGRGFLAIGILLMPLFVQAEISGHQQRMLEFAEHAIVQGKGAEPELGLDVIGEGNGPQSLQFLTELVRWQRGMDAGQGESYTCYLLSKGNAILPYLEQMDPAALRQKCVAEFNGRKYGLKSSDNVDYICRSEKNIRLKKADIIAGIRDGIVCNDEDW